MLKRYNSNTSMNSAAISMSSTYDQQSLMSNRKASRLSNFNPIKNRAASKDFNYPPVANGSNGGANGSANSAGQYGAINASNSSYYNLTPVSTSSADYATTNYHLTKMETNDSIDSNFSLQQQFKIELNLNKKDIELIRYTWNKMLLDEPAQTNTSLPIPGSFNFQATLQQEAAKSGDSHIKTANNIASSLFCRQLYSNLLSMDPTLEKLFPSIKHQAVAFAGVMSFTISQLENLSTLNDYLESLGKRHSRILGIEPSMFEIMGEAMIQTFHERFGTRFNQELEILWIKLYLYLANSLLQFGIDPILKLGKIDSSNSFDHSYQHQHNHHSMFRMNDNHLNYQNTNMSRDNSDLFSVDDRKSSVASSTNSLPMKKEKAMKKKKKDCVIQ